MSNDQPNRWILEPVASAILFLGDEHVLAGIIERSLVTMRGFPRFLDLAMASPGLLTPTLNAQFRHLQAQAQNDAALVDRDPDRFFERVYAHHLVAIWAATETCIETTLQNCYFYIDRADEIARAHGHTSAKPSASSWHARSTVRGWRDKLKDMPELRKDELILKAFQINVSFTTDDVERAEQLSEIRNCLVHNKSVVSPNLLKRCPALQARWHENDAIRLERKDAENAFEICARILQSILSSILGSNHLKFISPAPSA